MKIKNGEFQRNFLRLFSGTVLGQTIPILVLPLVSRLYSPTEIGSFALYSSVAAIIINVVCLKFDQAIIIPANRKEAKRIFHIALKISKYVSVAGLIVVSICKLLSLFDFLAPFPNWWFLIGLHIYFLGIHQSSMFFLNRSKHYEEISRSKIYNGVSYSLFQVLFFKLSEFGLVLSLFLSRLIVAKYLFKKTNQAGGKAIAAKGALVFGKTDRALIKKYRHFPIYSASNSLLNSTSNHLPILLLNGLYSASVAGIYSWANRIIQTPMGFITSSIQQVFYQEAAERVSNGKTLYHFVWKTYKRMFMIGVVPYTTAFFFAPEIFSFVFGDEWTQAGYYTKYLVPWLFIVFLNSPITAIIPILNQQRSFFINELVLFFLRAIALLLGYFVFNNSDSSVLLFGIVGAVYNAYLFFYLINVCKRWERSIIA